MPGGGLHFGARVGNGHRPAHEGHCGKVVDVVPHVGHTLWVEPVGREPSSQCGRLVVNALKDIHAEFLGAGRDDRVAFGGQDQEGDGTVAQAGHSHPV